MALGRRHPNDELVHHADRGLRYTSLEFSTRLAGWGITPSFSRTGNCFDNAAMESTGATVKKEIRHIYGDSSQTTRARLRTILFAYIETFYNRARHQARLGHRTPATVYAHHAAGKGGNACPTNRVNSSS
jgi:putative transposase